MKKFITSNLFIISLFLQAYSINYVSNNSGPWTTSTSWLPVGVPGSGDNVTILSGHNISLNVTTRCVDMTINSGGTFTGLSNAAILSIYGTYLNNGTEAGFAQLAFFGSGSPTIGGTGVFCTNFSWSFNKSRTISSNVNYTRAANTKIYAGAVVTNLGSIVLNTSSTFAGSGWINGVNSSLTVKTSNFFAGTALNAGTFNASAIGNTVSLQYTSGDVPNTVSGYYNLSLTGTSSGSKLLRSNTIITNNLTINSTNTLNSNNFDLTVGGNWTSSGTFTATAGKTVTFNGTSSQSVSNTLGTTRFKGLAINNTAGVTLMSGTYILDEVLTVSNGTFNTGGRTFTMTSTATQTARIAPITGTGAIAGNFTVNRFITSRDTTWTDLSSPVQNSTFNDWDNELPALFYGYSPPTQYPTQWTYDESADDFSPVTSAATALTPGKGYEVFMSGDYTYTNLPNTTVNTIGVPNQGDQDLSGLISFNSSGSNLVGNPFASSIKWSDVFTVSSGILNTYDVYDFASGNYATFGLGTEIGATQGFWVYTTTSTATLLVPESSKSTASNSSIKSATTEPYLSLKFSSNDANNSYYHTLKVVADNNASDGWDLNDHPFRKSPNKLAPSIYSVIDGKTAVINSFNASDDNFSMPVTVAAAKNGYYKIEASGFENVSDYSCITLEDKLLNKSTDLSKEAYSFELNTEVSADRFVLHLSKSGNCKTSENSDMTNDLNSHVTVLPTIDGNSVTFNFEEATPADINVTNILGQNIIETTAVIADNQTVNINLPQNFSGMYIVKIESSKGVVTKKYIRK